MRERRERRSRLAASIGILVGFAVLISLYLGLGKPFEPVYLALLGGVITMLIPLLMPPPRGSCRRAGRSTDPS